MRWFDHGARVRCSWRHVVRSRRHGVRGRLTRYVARYLDEDRTAAWTERLAQRARDDVARVARRETRLPLADRREQRAQLELLVRRAGAERRDADARYPTRARHRVGHERRRGFMTGQHELEPGLAEALDEIDDLAAGMPGHVSDARFTQALSDDARDARLAHAKTLSGPRARSPLYGGCLGEGADLPCGRGSIWSPGRCPTARSSDTWVSESLTPPCGSSCSVSCPSRACPGTPPTGTTDSWSSLSCGASARRSRSCARRPGTDTPS